MKEKMSTYYVPDAIPKSLTYASLLDNPKDSVKINMILKFS